MTRWTLAATASILAGCSADSTAPTRGQHAAGGSPAAAVLGAPSLVLNAPGQLVTLEDEGGKTEQAWFEAEMVVRAGGTGDALPTGDGAILVVSAADGPMPQTSPDAERLRIEIAAASVESDGTVRFSGFAFVTMSDGERTTFDIAGSARPRASCCNTDELIWDIVGGNVHITFAASAVIRDLTGTT